MQKSTVSVIQSDATSQLILLFPKIDPNWLSMLLSKYKSNQYTNSLELIQIVSTKITEIYHGWYPSTPFTDPNSLEARNMYLYELVERFPSVELSYLRSLVSNQQFNHVFKISEILLEMDKTKEGYPKRTENVGMLEERDLFRCEAYIQGCKAQLLNEFPKQWESTIKGIMAECNQDYISSKIKLQSLRESWFSQLCGLVILRKPIIIPELSHTDLVNEIQSVRCREIQKQDQDFALELNQTEYSDAGQYIPCQCCFADCTFEELGSCSYGHLFCGNCISQFVNESLFGQGDLRARPITCVDMESLCTGTFEESTLNRFIPEKNLCLYYGMLSRIEITLAGISLIQCPFCPFAAAAELESNRIKKWSKTIQNFMISKMDTLSTCSWTVPWVFAFLSIFFSPSSFLLSLFLSLYIKKGFESQGYTIWLRQLKKSIKEPNLVLNCRNPSCMKSSCVSCQSEWEPLHQCHEQEQESFRLFVEKAMSNAMIRTCPNCQLGFSKLDGCNLIKCPNCKYVMCFLCRKDIRFEKYQHFCQHFRAIPGPCTVCQKCDLYQTREERVVLMEAAKKAKQDWLARHPHATQIDLSLDDFSL